VVPATTGGSCRSDSHEILIAMADWLEKQTGVPVENRVNPAKWQAYLEQEGEA
jgi:hypothetical protein